MIGDEKENGKRGVCQFRPNGVDSVLAVTMKHLLIEKGEMGRVVNENRIENDADAATTRHFNVSIRHSVD
jgi:hypothetical protein